MPDAALARSRGLAPFEPLAADTLEIPRVVASIWLGSPLSTRETSRAFWHNVQAAAIQYHGDFSFVVFTDLTRATVDRVRAEVTQPADPYLAEVWRMLAWAKGDGRYRIHLVNIDEVFHDQAPMLLDRLFRLNANKQDGPGWAAASDLLRWELVNRW